MTGKEDMEKLLKLGKQIQKDCNVSLDNIFPVLDKDSPKFIQQFSEEINKTVKKYAVQTNE